MIRSATTTLDAGDESVSLSLEGLGQPNCTAAFFLSNTSMTTGVWKVQAKPAGQDNWVNIGWVDMASLTVQSAGNFSATNSTDYIIVVPSVGWASAVRLYLVSVGSGSYAATAYGMSEQEARDMNFPVSIINSATAQTITSTSATAFSVGRQGSTNPVLNVNANTASVVTGLTLIGAAAGSGMQVTVTSSGTNEGLLLDAKGTGTIRLGATSTGAIEFSRAAIPTADDGVALGSATNRWADLFLAEGGVINWDNGDATITQTNNVIAIAGVTSVTCDGQINPATNDAASLGTTALGWADLHLATGGVINWANGEVTITETDANTLTFAGATVISFGSNTLNATGTRITQSYHTNITSTNAVTVDSSETVKQFINPYKGDALETIRRMDVITYRHKGHLDNGQTKLGVRAESVNEPLAVDHIKREDGDTYPGVNLYSLAAVQTRAIQQLSEKIERLERVAA